MTEEEITIMIPGPLITFKSAAWGAGQKELYLASQEAIRAAVQQSSECSVLRGWLIKRVKLKIDVEFHLKTQRAINADLDSMLGDLFNPLVEGACGPRPAQKPIPQMKDSLFWECHATKSFCGESEERTVVRICPLNRETLV
jgi:hypothetical protein